jgi:hypothetical protein
LIRRRTVHLSRRPIRLAICRHGRRPIRKHFARHRHLGPDAHKRLRAGKANKKYLDAVMQRSQFLAQGKRITRLPPSAGCGAYSVDATRYFHI